MRKGIESGETLRSRRWPSWRRSKVPPSTTAPYDPGADPTTSVSEIDSSNAMGGLARRETGEKGRGLRRVLGDLELNEASSSSFYEEDELCLFFFFFFLITFLPSSDLPR